MAAPNIVNVSSIEGKTVVASATTTATAMVTNSSGSNKVFKVNAMYVSNIHASSSADVTVDLFRSSTAYRIAANVTVPSKASIDMLSKSIYLEEGDALRITASANSILQAVCSYEELA